MKQGEFRMHPFPIQNPTIYMKKSNGTFENIQYRNVEPA